MAKYTKNNAVGVDEKINYYIDILDDYLNTKKSWGVDIYHKVYRELNSQDVYVPYVFTSGKDYKEIFLNDRTNGEVAFRLSEGRTYNSFVSVDCDVIFSINLDKLDNGSLQREDERALMVALAAVNECEDVTAIKTGLTNVFSEFDTDRIKFRDMHPFLNMSFTININYKNNRCYGVY